MLISDKEPKPDSKTKIFILDILNATLAAMAVAVGYFIFITPNGFAPGGISGIATIISTAIWPVKYALYNPYLIVALNLPLFIIVFFLINKKKAVYLTYYIVLQSALGLLFAKIKVFDSFVQANCVMKDQRILPALAGGIISGFGFALMIRRFSASGGTYAIASIIKRKRPAWNIAWLSFVMDATVVIVILFVNPTGKVDLAAALCTLINLYVADKVVDLILRGVKSGYKFEIITDTPTEISEEIINTLGRSVTEVHAMGMFSNTNKELLICLVRKRELSDFYKILKKYPNTFTYMSQVSEVVGKFKH